LLSEVKGIVGGRVVFQHNSIYTVNFVLTAYLLSVATKLAPVEFHRRYSFLSNVRKYFE